MRRLVLLASLVLFVGCTSVAPTKPPSPFPTEGAWASPSPCVVGLVIGWSDGTTTTHVVPEELVCPDSI